MNALSSRMCEIHGVDISKEAIIIGRKNLGHLENLHFHVTEGDNLSMFEDGTIDLVYSIHCFQHIPKAVTLKYFLEAKRVMKQTGYFVFQVVNKPHKNQLDIGLIKRETTIGFSPELLTQMINESGLKLEAITPQPNYPWLWVVARKSAS